MTRFMTIVVAVSLWAWLVAHQVAIYYAVSVLIEQLPPPVPTTGPVYRYIYGVFQLIAANWRRTKDAVKPTGGSNVS